MFRLLTTLSICTLLMMIVSQLSAADVTWDDGGGDANWSTAANWSGDTVPTSSDNVIFDGATSNAASTIDASFGGTVASVTVQSDYTGNITMAADLSVTGAFSLDGNPTSGSTWNASTYTLSVGGNGTIANTANMLDAGTGTITLSGAGVTIDNPASGNAFYNLTIDSSGTVTLASDIVVSNDVDISDGTLDTDATNSYALTITGDLLMSGSTTLTLNASTVTMTAGNWDTNANTTVNYGTSTLALEGGSDHQFRSSHTANDITIAASSTVGFGTGFAASSLTIGAGATVDFQAMGTVDIDDFTVNGTSGNDVTLRSDDAYAVWFLDVDATGTQSIAYADFLDCDARAGDTIDATSNGTDSGRNYNIDFGQTPTYDLATCDSSDLQTVYLRFSEAMDETSAETTGNYTVSGGIGVNSATLSGDGKVVTLAVDANVTIDTTTVQASSSITSLVGTAIAGNTRTIEDGTSDGVADADAVTLALSTDGDGQSIILRKATGVGGFSGLGLGTGEELKITVPGTSATTVDISQLPEPGGSSQVKFGSSGNNYSASVTTSGGTPNEASVVVRFSKVGTSKDDLRLRAHISGSERASHATTAVTASFNGARCVYLSDSRPLQQKISLTPGFSGVQLETKAYMVNESVASLSTMPGPTTSTSDVNGDITWVLVPHGWDLYCAISYAAARSFDVSTPSAVELSDYLERCQKEKSSYTWGPKTDNGDASGQKSCPDYESSDAASGKSVDLIDGEKKLNLIDLFIPGRGFGFAFERSYRSHDYIDAFDVDDFGAQWRFSYAYDYLVKDGSGNDSDANYIQIRSGGSARAFVNRDTDEWGVEESNFIQLTRDSSANTFSIRAANGDVHVFNDFSDGSTPNANGRLIEIRDRNDNSLTVHYEEIDPDGTASNGDEKMVVAYVIDTLGREIRYQYYAATSQTASGRTLTIVDANAYKQGRLAKVIDFKGDMDFSDSDASEDFTGQTNNRTLTFDYDSESNLVRASSPVVSGTPNSNDFSSGKTTLYQYYTDSHHPDLTGTEWNNLSSDDQERLRHCMTHIWYPNEVQGTPGSNPSDSDAAEIIGYEVDDTDAFFGFATSYTRGGENGNGVPSGGTVTYTYVDKDTKRNMGAGASTDPTIAYNQTALEVTVDDRNGNDAVYTYGGGKNLKSLVEDTNGLRTGEPTDFTTTHSVNEQLMTSDWDMAEGNTIDYTYNDEADDVFQRGNLIRIIRTPDARGADQDTIEEVFVYEPIYNRPCLHVTARGANSTANDFTPPIADVVTRTMTDPYDATKTLDLRYATVEYFDYQESETMADSWAATSGSAMAGQTVDSEEVLATEVLLLRELNLPETTAGVQELRQRLEDNLTNLALGDLNGDNNTDPVVAGNVIRTVQASPVLVDGSNQHELEDDIETAGDLIDETVGYGAGGTAESTSGDRLQTIVTMRQYNDFGQLTKVISPEGNVSTFDYFAEEDPDGDSTTTPTPADVATRGSLDTSTGGYLKERVADDTRNYYDQDGTDKSSATFSNNNTDPAETEMTVSYTYDDVGNVITSTNGRGIRTDYFVNELNQTVRTTRAADISGASTASPSDPLYNHSNSDEELTAFAYKSRRFFDYNNNVVLSQTEDRQNTSSVDGQGLGTLPSQATDTTPGLSSYDSAGGDAYVDALTLFDRLDNRIETRVEVDSSNSLDTKFRYDGNENLVLTIFPEGNATSAVYDERDLVFQRISGTSTRPTAGKYATGDPTTFNRPGGSGTAASTVTYNYDKNENLKEVVDAEDTDSDSNNNSSIAGSGDVTTFAYDGYDRQITITDPLGNSTTKVYDADSNVIRIIQDGDPEDDVVGTTGNKTLAVTEFVHDNQNRVIFTHKVLYQTQDHTPTRTPTLDDSDEMDALSIYLSDANSDTAAVPDAISGITVLGRVTTMQEYDRQSRTTFRVQDDMDTYMTGYDGASRTIKTTDSAIANGYDEVNDVFDPANIDGNTVEMAYDDNSNLIEQLETDVTEIANVADETFRTTFIYDALDRRQTMFDNLGQADDCRYDSRSNKTACADAEGPLTVSMVNRTFNRRGLGSTASVNINFYGNVTRYIYDGISRKLEDEVRLTSSGSGDGSNIGADLEGDFTTAPTVDTNQSGDGLLSTHYAYDDNSQLIGLRDDNGNTTVYIYDNQNRMLVDRKGLAETGTSFSITSGDSGAFNVALRGAATTPVNSESSGTDNTYTYDKDSNIATWENEGDVSGNQSTMTYTYDALNRRKTNSVAHAMGSAFIGTEDQSWEYDGLSRMTECIDENDTGTNTDNVIITYFYDSLSRKVEEEQKIGTSGTAYQISHSYDISTCGCDSSQQLPSSCTYPDGRVVDNVYDHLDRLVSKTDNGQASAIGTYQYIGKWRVGTLTYQNDTRLTHIGQVASQNADIGFDSLRRVIDHRWEFDSTGSTALGSGTLIVGFGHQDNSGNPNYDRMNNKLTEEKQHAADLSEVYEYDSAYRVIEFDRGTLNTAKTAVNTASSLPSTLQNQTFTLDGVHNWNSNSHTSQGGTQQTENRTHSDFNEISAVTGTPYGSNATTGTHVLDKNGNLTDDGTLEYEWDALNRLHKVSRKSDGALIATYTYDCHNRRFRKVITNGGLDGEQSASTTDYYYDNWQVLEERDGSDSILRQYVYGNYIDEPWVLDIRGGTTDDLIQHWELDESSGSTASDSTSNSYDGTLTNFPVDDSQWVSGRFDNGLDFDGTNDHVVDSDAENHLNGLDAVTIALWVKSDVTNQDRGIFTTDTPSGSDNRLSLRYDKDGFDGGGSSLIKAAISTSSGTFRIESPSSVQSTGWQHLALRWEAGSDLQLFIDGRAVTPAATNGTSNLGGTIANVTTLLLGQGVKSTYWDGTMDDVRVYDRALTPSEIAGLASTSADIAELNDGSGTQRQFYHCNTQYSIHALTDEAGSITEGYIYDAYGRQTVFTANGADTTWFTNDDTIAVSANSAVGSPYGYTGRRFDSETELGYFRNRYYSSDTGRFVNRDPIGYVDGWSLYNSYFTINGLDPFGHKLQASDVWQSLFEKALEYLLDAGCHELCGELCRNCCVDAGLVSMGILVKAYAAESFGCTRLRQPHAMAACLVGVKLVNGYMMYELGMAILRCEENCPPCPEKEVKREPLPYDVHERIPWEKTKSCIRHEDKPEYPPLNPPKEPEKEGGPGSELMPLPEGGLGGGGPTPPKGNS